MCVMYGRVPPHLVKTHSAPTHVIGRPSRMHVILLANAYTHSSTNIFSMLVCRKVRVAYIYIYIYIFNILFFSPVYLQTR
jgi:hypothetical protein